MTAGSLIATSNKPWFVRRSVLSQHFVGAFGGAAVIFLRRVLTCQFELTTIIERDFKNLQINEFTYFLKFWR